MGRIVLWCETVFLACFWLQTRLDISKLFPQLSRAPIVSDYLVPYLYLSDILFGLTFIIWLADWVMNRRLREKNSNGDACLVAKLRGGTTHWNNWGLWFGLFLGVTALSLWMNRLGWWGWWRWLKLVEGGAMVWFFSARLRRPTLARRYGILLLTGLGFESLLLVVEWLRQSSMGLQWLGEWRFNVQTPGVAKIVFHGQEWLRPMATFAHPNIAGGVLALALPVGIFWEWTTLNKWGLPQDWMRAMRWTWAGLAIVALLVTFSRTAWIVAVIGIVWAGVAMAGNWQQFWRTRLYFVDRKRVLSGILGLLFVLGLILPLVVGRFSSLSTTDELSYERRIQLSSVAIDLWRQHLWLGVGLNNFVVQLAGYGPLYGIGVWRQPVHDFWLIVGVETGLVGFLCLLGFFVVIWRRLFEGGRLLKKVELKILLGVWIGWLLLGVGDHYWWTSQQGMLMTWLVCGASIAIFEILPKSEPKVSS